jgi:hypothetical protein
MNPSGSAKGGYFFLSLLTGKCLSWQQIMVLFMPDWVIQHVEDIAEAEDQCLMNNGEALWEWRSGKEIEDLPEPPPEPINVDLPIADDDHFNDEDPHAPVNAPNDIPNPLLLIQDGPFDIAADDIAHQNVNLVGDNADAEVIHDPVHQPFLVSDADDSDLSSGESISHPSLD